MTLFGYWVRQDSHAGRVRTARTVFMWRPDGRRVVDQLPDDFAAALEAEGMELR
ncbi:hypothetical protein [Kribbella soli]|uniref:hypothetical protein n=1 Tax=Kribbella soli TaxID=1124743 RepID=UPI0013F3D2D8|nr:hypothetical protein [Kribbella soli]